MGQKTNALRPGVTVFRFAESWCPKYPHRAGWSSLVARQAHNLKVAGSNPAPATIFLTHRDGFCDQAHNPAGMTVPMRVSSVSYSRSP